MLEFKCSAIDSTDVMKVTSVQGQAGQCLCVTANQVWLDVEQVQVLIKEMQEWVRRVDNDPVSPKWSGGL